MSWLPRACTRPLKNRAGDAPVVRLPFERSWTCYRTVTTSGGFKNCWGHSDVKTTMIYTHVLNRGGHGVESPLDRLRKGPAVESRGIMSSQRSA